jgi:hypothetical protein
MIHTARAGQEEEDMFPADMCAANKKRMRSCSGANEALTTTGVHSGLVRCAMSPDATH